MFSVTLFPVLPVLLLLPAAMNSDSTEVTCKQTNVAAREQSVDSAWTAREQSVSGYFHWLPWTGGLLTVVLWLLHKEEIETQDQGRAHDEQDRVAGILWLHSVNRPGRGWVGSAAMARMTPRSWMKWSPHWAASI